MRTRGIRAAEAGEIGRGCKNLSHAYGVPPEPTQAVRVVQRALELGVAHFDTAALYGFGGNEMLLGELLQPFRGRVHLARKCGRTGVDGKRVIDGHQRCSARSNSRWHGCDRHHRPLLPAPVGRVATGAG